MKTTTKPFANGKKATLFTVYTFLFFLTPIISNAQFWTEDFDFGIPSDWHNDDELNNGIKWEHCENPFNCAPSTIPVDFLEEPRFMSTSALNGYAFINSNGGEAHISTLITTPINCENALDRVVLFFETHIGFRLTPPNESAFVRVKNTNSDWVTFNFFENLGIWADSDRESCNAERIYIDITDIAAGESEVQIEWRWSAENDLSWAIDDIALFDYHPLEEGVVWGKKSGQGDFKDGFNDWTSVTISGDCDWYWEPVGWVGNSIFTPVPNDLKICSQTGNNGAAVFHPDLCFGQSGVLTPTIAELISPTIDLSNVISGEGLVLEFDQLFAEGNPIIPNQPVTSVMFSIDNGQNWLDTLNCNPQVCFGNANFENSSFRTALPPEVLGTSEFKLKFAFNGQLFFWVIDDVRILEKKPNDLKLNPDFYAIPPTAQIPNSQFEPFGLMVDLENVGNLTQTNTRILAHIENETGALVYGDTLNLGTFAPGQMVVNTPFDKLVDFEPIKGKYKGYYRVESDNIDDFTADNEISWDFELTQGLFSKEFGPCIGTGFSPTANFIHEVGNAFYIIDGDSLVASQVSFSLANPKQIQGKTVFTNLYEWKEDVNGDFKANEEEITLLASNEYTVLEDEEGIITIDVNFDETNPCRNLEDNTFYIVSLVLGNPSAEKHLIVSATERLNYNPSFFVANELGKGDLKSFPMLRIGNDPDFDAFGFGLDRIPVVRLHTKKYCDEVATFDPSLPQLDVSLFPNPVSDEVFISMDEETIQQSISLEIFDNSGKIVLSRQFDNIIVKQLPVNVAFLPEGYFILRLISENGVGIKKIVKIY